MSASPLPTDLWLERSRFQGIILDAVSYGILFVLTIQSIHALFQRRKHASNDKSESRNRWMLLAYVVVTFMLATLGFAANAEYSQVIWIDKRNSPGGPPGLIVHQSGFWENKLALTSYYVMSWIVDLLLIYRCSVIWNRHILVVVFMSSLLLANVVMAIFTLVVSSHDAVFNGIGFQLAYLVISVSTNLIYTILIAGRLLAMRRQITTALGNEHAKIYVSTAAMVVESSALYTGFGIIYVVSYALGSYVDNLIFLWITHVQAIAQLLIILRIARGKAITEDVITRPTTHLELATAAITSDPSQTISVSMSVHHHRCTTSNDTSSFPGHLAGLSGSVTEEQKQEENSEPGTGTSKLTLTSGI